jgi:PLP dependent protein
MTELTAKIAENVSRVRGRMAEAAARAGRSADEVRLVAVTKYVGVEEIRALVRSGCTLLGESRAQHLGDMAPLLRDEPIRWHMIGHLQRNKIRRTLPEVDMIHSGDSPRLVEAVDRIAGELSLRMPMLLEVNVSGEADKGGFAPDEIEGFLAAAAELRHVEIRGLMAMASLGGGLDAARRDFRRLSQLRDRLRRSCPAAVDLSELSMGMSGDYEVAIEEGATIVRVGSALFEGVLP